MSGARSLRQAVGEPNTEVEAWAEDIAGTPVEWQGTSEPSLTGSGRTGLRYTQELPAIEKVLGRWSLRRSKEGLALSRSTGGGYSLASIEEMVSDLLETAMEQEQEERINKLLDFQRTLGELNQRMASRSSSGSSQPSTFGHLSPNDILVTSVLRASRGRPSSSSFSSSSTFATAAVQEEVSAQMPCSSTTFASCPICFEAVTADRLHTVSGCGDHYYCIDCLAGHATALISVAEISERLSCPDPECGVRFTEADVQQLVPEEVYHRYLQFLVLAMLDACQHIWCPTCASPIITGDAAECPTPTSLTICPGCQSFICSLCSKAYHPETTCQGAAVTDPDLLAWLQEQGTKVKECPQCFAATEKNDGCNHMTCKCGAQWCWICGDHYGSTHFSSGFCSGLQFGASDTDLVEILVARKRSELVNASPAQQMQGALKELHNAHKLRKAEFFRANIPTIPAEDGRGRTKMRRSPEQVEQLRAFLATLDAERAQLKVSFKPVTTDIKRVIEEYRQSVRQILDLKAAERRQARMRALGVAEAPTFSSS